MVLSSWLGCTVGFVGTVAQQLESPRHFNEIGSMLQTRQETDIDLAVTTVGDGLGWTSPNWFNAQLAVLKTEADAIYADMDACNAQQNPKEVLVEAARDAHSKCREAQLPMAGMNLTKDCEDSKKSDCDLMQSTFELATCTHSDSRTAFCKEVDACHTAASHVVTKTGVTWKESALKEEFVHYKQFECRMSKWPLTQAEKQHCKDLQPDTSHLSVTYPSQPSATPCAKLIKLPGDVAWLAEEYSSKNWSKLVKTATKCVDVDVLSGLPARDPSLNVCPSTEGLWEKATWVLAADKKNCKESCAALGKTCNKDTIELTNRVCTFAAFEHILQSPTLQLVPNHTYKSSWTAAIVNKMSLTGKGPNGFKAGPFLSNNDFVHGAGKTWEMPPSVPVPTDDARCSVYLPPDTIQSVSVLCACV